MCSVWKLSSTEEVSVSAWTTKTLPVLDQRGATTSSPFAEFSQRRSGQRKKPWWNVNSAIFSFSRNHFRRIIFHGNWHRNNTVGQEMFGAMLCYVWSIKVSCFSLSSCFLRAGLLWICDLVVGVLSDANTICWCYKTSWIPRLLVNLWQAGWLVLFLDCKQLALYSLILENVALWRMAWLAQVSFSRSALLFWNVQKQRSWECQHAFNTCFTAKHVSCKS